LCVFILFTLTYPAQQFLQEIVKETLFDFVLQILLDYSLVKFYLLNHVGWLEAWHRLDWERIFILGEISLETTVITDFVCPSVSLERIFVLFPFTREKPVHTHVLENTAIIGNPKDPSRGKIPFGK
jgi:hypothetical protein